MDPGMVTGPAVMDRPGAALLCAAKGGGFPFRDLVVARTDEPLADAAATLVARALAERLGDVAVIRAEDEVLERHARHAALAVVGTPLRRRPAGMAGGDASALAKRLGVPVVIVPQRCAGTDLRGVRSIVCGVRSSSDVVSVAVAGALADALDLQLVLVHVREQPQLNAAGPFLVPPAASAEATPQDCAAARELVGAVARRAGRTAPGAACARVVEGMPGELLGGAGRDHRAALIAVTASRRGRLASAVLGGTARHVIRHADRPVLVCPTGLHPALEVAVQNADGS
jgi:nucleotide-binding universal stress UspA family protein